MPACTSWPCPATHTSSAVEDPAALPGAVLNPYLKEIDCSLSVVYDAMLEGWGGHMGDELDKACCTRGSIGCLHVLLSTTSP